MSSDIELAPATSDTERTGPRIPGEPGLWVFLLGDMVVFAVFFVAFLMERAKEPEVFTASRESLGLTIGLTNTMILLTSSLLVVMGLNAVRLDRRPLGGKLFLGAIALGVVFTVLKCIEYTQMIGHGHGPDVDAYFMWFFILTGTHLFHVVIGLAVLRVLWSKTRMPLSMNGSDRALLEGGACYWHLVDLLWMVLFPLVYLAV